jgi:hypothetical protein
MEIKILRNYSADLSQIGGLTQIKRPSGAEGSEVVPD